MSFIRVAAATVAASILCGGVADAGGPLHVFKHGLWSGGAYTDDRTGAFSHCSASVAYDTGINLFILVTADYRWWLGFINPEWSFKPKVKLPVRLRLDDRETSLERQAIIPNGQLILIPLPDSSRLVDGLRHSSQLALEAEGQSFFFKLNEIPAAMDRLTNCVRASLELKDKIPTAGSLRGQEENGSAKAGSVAAVTQPAASSVAGSPSAGRSPSPSASTKTAESAPPQPTAIPAPDTASVTESPPASAKTTGASAVGSQSVLVPDSELAPRGSGSSDATASTPRAAVSPNPMDALHPAVAEGSPVPPPTRPPAAKPISPPLSSSMASLDAESGPGGPTKFRVANAGPQVAPATTDQADTPSQATNPTAASPPLAFTALTPVMPAPPALVSPSEPATAAAEEVRLASHFLAKARLSDAHLVNADKPPALEQFTAVWRSEDAAGAVKIVPGGPNVSAIGIASNLIAVDPQICDGDFTAARFRTDFGHRAVFSAVLTCGKGNEQRVTEYFVVPRDRGGFVVFAVIRSKALGPPDFHREMIDGLSRAAIEAAEGQG